MFFSFLFFFYETLCIRHRIHNSIIMLNRNVPVNIIVISITI